MVSFLKSLTDFVLYFSCIFILGGCLFLTFRMRFIQFRLFGFLWRLLNNSFKANKLHRESHTILPHRALFTAMSTTIGISTIVAPILVIRLGGPGALLGFVITSLLGSAATYVEVNLSIRHRKIEQGGILGGPMQYLKAILSKRAAKWYAFSCTLLMAVWSAAQANQVAAIFSSPMLGKYAISPSISGAMLAVFVLMIVLGGIRRIGSFSARLVPLMFVFYVGSCLWILFLNIDRWGEMFHMMFSSLFNPYQLATGVTIGGTLSALRWGVFKGLQTNEAGVGTQAIPHSMAETNDPVEQAAIAMVSTYMAGFVAFLSGCVALLTNTWQDPALPLGISMVAASFKVYFSFIGVMILSISALLFGFGTILGNSYNGSQCFSYLTKKRGLRLYFLATASMIFLGSIAEVTVVWSLIDIFMIFMAIPHMGALMLYTYREKGALLNELQVTRKRLQSA